MFSSIHFHLYKPTFLYDSNIFQASPAPQVKSPSRVDGGWMGETVSSTLIIIDSSRWSVTFSLSQCSLIPYFEVSIEKDNHFDLMIPLHSSHIHPSLLKVSTSQSLEGSQVRHILTKYWQLSEPPSPSQSPTSDAITRQPPLANLPSSYE